MKQHITPEDLATLTPEQKEKLRAQWSVKEFDVFIVSNESDQKA